MTATQSGPTGREHGERLRDLRRGPPRRDRWRALPRLLARPGRPGTARPGRRRPCAWASATGSWWSCTPARAGRSCGRPRPLPHVAPPAEPGGVRPRLRPHRGGGLLPVPDGSPDAPRQLCRRPRRDRARARLRDAAGRPRGVGGPAGIRAGRPRRSSLGRARPALPRLARRRTSPTATPGRGCRPARSWGTCTCGPPTPTRRWRSTATRSASPPTGRAARGDVRHVGRRHVLAPARLQHLGERRAAAATRRGGGDAPLHAPAALRRTTWPPPSRARRRPGTRSSGGAATRSWSIRPAPACS